MSVLKWDLIIVMPLMFGKFMQTPYNYRFKSKIENICPVQSKIMDIAEALGFDEDAQYCLRLALDESMANAIVHGNRMDETKDVQVTVIPFPDKIEISVSDEGCGFNCDQLPDPRNEDNLQKPNGRGIFLIREFSSEVSFNEKGNQITFAIHRCSTNSMLQSYNR